MGPNAGRGTRNLGNVCPAASLRARARSEGDRDTGSSSIPASTRRFLIEPSPHNVDGFDPVDEGRTLSDGERDAGSSSIPASTRRFLNELSARTSCSTLGLCGFVNGGSGAISSSLGATSSGEGACPRVERGRRNLGLRASKSSSTLSRHVGTRVFQRRERRWFYRSRLHGVEATSGRQELSRSEGWPCQGELSRASTFMCLSGCFLGRICHGGSMATGLMAGDSTKGAP
ncbi:hypothetical protein IQ07DRAFT_262602 [Pyrenochaeta sp. DS3sAY3a]|nr:hypothetical protein IQ07DRAFT_262602 [Pyrenochaeta sp. DS3sAY3a]